MSGYSTVGVSGVSLSGVGLETLKILFEFALNSIPNIDIYKLRRINVSQLTFGV